ncbi:hypothetical protein ASG72_07660 [Bosea sp. Leaf344]|uniref:hypothetical protein n=1 Tax=Bosea sp. Leaf344 TaxID=1736346 RepID=UPI00071525B6|nr:hypothetical protein [Bosea sp. Leaf344]KQU52763.1 hypothetical protein ASG72_07660 [Bosea sp. Leaf344]
MRPLLLLPLLALAACTVTTSRVSKVVVTENKAVVASCTKVGDVDGASALNRLLLRDKARDAALTQLKAAGADLGASHVLSPVADIKWKGEDYKGVAYRC